MGNLYTDEALHYAKLHPLRPANKLKPDDWQRLHAGIIKALRMGIAARGSSLGTTLRDHINVDGAPGQNQRPSAPTAAKPSPATERHAPHQSRAAAAASSARNCQPARGARPAHHDAQAANRARPADGGHDGNGHAR